jgi:acetyl-CoA carboxylase biotin carboxyl carrier protein
MPSSRAAVDTAPAKTTSETGAGTLLDIEKIRELVEMMMANDLVEISLRDGETEVNLRRPGAVVEGVPVVTAASHPVAPPAALVPGAAPEAAPAAEVVASTPEVELVEVKSPMVGTYYSASEPGAPPFIEVGSNITAETVVCIVEAMKVFNEIKAEVSGVVEKILVKNESPVEYGQPLFLVRPH